MKHITILSLLLFLFACSDTEEPNIPEEENMEEVTEETPIIDVETLEAGALGFTWDLFQESHSEFTDSENLLISPLSIQVAMYMTANGARNNTLEQMMSMLQLQDINLSGLNESYDIYASELSDNTEEVVSISNGVFYDSSMEVAESFQSNLTDYFSADFENLNFGDSESVDIINSWAEEKTEGRISEVLDEISSDEVMFIINALYYKADWETPFSEYGTQPRAFQLDNGEIVSVDMMLSDNGRNYYLGDDMEAVDLLFKGGNYAMTFVRPKEANLNQWISGFSSNEIQSLFEDLYENKLQEGRLLLSLPKFEIKGHYSLASVLTKLGMIDAFSQSNADLSGLGTSMGNLFITRVMHDSFLKIDEKGAEGAAVTTVGVGTTSVPPTLFLDSPFLFSIRHIESNAILFLGKMGNPNDL